MRRRDFLSGSLAAGLGAFVSPAASGSVRPIEGAEAESAPADALIYPVDLRCESLRDPLGIDARRPRLSWKLEAVGTARSQVQSAYRVRVATTATQLAEETPDLWDSGRVESSRQLHVEYEGRAPRSGERCFWQVEVWDGAHRKSQPSPASWWEMGLLSASDWVGVWISDGKPVGGENPVWPAALVEATRQCRSKRRSVDVD